LTDCCRSTNKKIDAI